jgi:dephospho-CoA kinase
MMNKNNKLIILGLTGGIASGKSLVAGMFAELGASVIDADTLGHEAMAPGGPAYDAVVANFGGAVLNEDGTVNRNRLAQIVFDDPARRAVLEEVTHPHIIDLMGMRIEEAIQAGSKFMVVEAALLIEKGPDQVFSGIIVVYADPEAQATRLSGRSGVPLGEAQKRIAAQLPLISKVGRADFVIDNTGTIEDTRQQVIRVYFSATSPDTPLEKLKPPA